MASFPFTELTESELQAVRGGDICIVGYEAVDTNGDGTPDILVPIYEECLQVLGSSQPTMPT